MDRDPADREADDQDGDGAHGVFPPPEAAGRGGGIIRHFAAGLYTPPATAPT